MQLPTTPSFRLDGKRALVTGASRGIGLAASAALASAGAEVTLAARNQAEVTAVAEAINAAGGLAKAIKLDVTDQASVQALVGGSTYDVLFNSAGTNRPAYARDVTETDYDEVMALNVKAALFLTRGVAESMRATGRGGSIINVSSQMGHVGGPKRTVYCASKHALEGITKTLAWEYGPDNIRINTLCPTFVRTPMTRPMLEDPAFEELVLSKIALQRLGELEDIMGPTLLLASEAGALITGSALLVDGGWTAI